MSGLNIEKTLLKIVKAVLALFLLCSCGIKSEDEIKTDGLVEDITESETQEEIIDTKEKTYSIGAFDEGEIIFYASDDYYRYGPSIIKNGDGTMDVWFSSPGNSGSQWDWITYRHYDGTEWSEEKVVLKPTPGSKDRCSVCDPGVIYFDGYYYLAYTATDYYEGKGTYNMAFVSRSKNPDGPFEKWNGSGWGGDPKEIIFYDGGQQYWGIGEVSFVIKDDELFVYYSYVDIRDIYIALMKADLCENWPATLREKGPVLYQLNHDSVEVVYDEDRDTFYAFSIDERLLESSKLVVYESKNGKDFKEITSLKEGIEDYAHNLGVAKNKQGHIFSDEELLIGYAYGKNWGRWNTKFQHFQLKYE